MGNFYRGYINGTPRSHSVGIDLGIDLGIDQSDNGTRPSDYEQVWISPTLKLVTVTRTDPETGALIEQRIHDLAAFSYSNVNASGATTLEIFTGKYAQKVPHSEIFPDEFPEKKKPGRPPVTEGA